MKPEIRNLFAAFMLFAGLGIETAAASPIAVITGPHQLLPGQTISLSGAASSDSTPGAVLSFAWDLNDDGIYTDAAGSSANFTVGSSVPVGTVFTVGLRVSDNFGASATTLDALQVVRELPPAAVPEPVSVALFGLGVAALSACRRRRAGR